MKDNYAPPYKEKAVPNELRREVKIYLRETSLPHVRPGAINRPGKGCGALAINSMLASLSRDRIWSP